MPWFMAGLVLGLLLTVPLIVWTARRTERRVRRLEHRARASERMAELGTLTSGLAHEIKNPLSTIGLNVQLLTEDLEELAGDLPPDSPQHQRIAQVERRFATLTKETQRIQDILEDFLRFAGRVKLDLADVDINAMVDELADFFAPQAEAAKVRLRTQLASGLPPVTADVNHLKQALLNLMINACQAMTAARDNGEPSGGNDELMVRTARAGASENEEVLIQVTDTGPGMDEQMAGKVFQPYFSKSKGGTGLGLPTTRRIVEEHGGVVTLHTESGKGTSFTIALPVRGRDTVQQSSRAAEQIGDEGG